MEAYALETIPLFEQEAIKPKLKLVKPEPEPKPKQIKKLFTYFGNKAMISGLVWDLFGPMDAYVEPFVGCGSVLLSSPYPHRYEAINDSCCHLPNVFRSVKYHPEEVIDAACYARTELDLHMRHDYLISQRQTLHDLLMTDVKACDPELAGWWIWGINLWVGAGWCGDSVILSRGKVSAQKPTHRNQGILTLARKPANRNRGILTKGDRRQIITDMITAVTNRLIDVNILYGDFERVLTPSYTSDFGTTAVFLDPPYKCYTDKSDTIYTNDHNDTWTRARDWFMAHRNDPNYHIILCGQNNDWPDHPDDVRVHTWVGAHGMTKAKTERKQEKLYISKYCEDIKL